MESCMVIHVTSWHTRYALVRPLLMLVLLCCCVISLLLLLLLFLLTRLFVVAVFWFDIFRIASVWGESHWSGWGHKSCCIELLFAFAGKQGRQSGREGGGGRSNSNLKEDQTSEIGEGQKDKKSAGTGQGRKWIGEKSKLWTTENRMWIEWEGRMLIWRNWKWNNRGSNIKLYTKVKVGHSKKW